MSYKTPIIPDLTLKGLDKKIQDIQVLLEGLSWLTKSFGLSDRIVELRDDTPYVYPAVFEANKVDPISVMPSDTWASYCFWTSGDTSFDLNIKTPPKNPLIRTNISCIFYIDIKRIDNTSSYKETKTKLREDIFHFFNTVKVSGLLEHTDFIEDDITRVFNGFSIDDVDNRFKMYPKWACRMDFDITYRDDCYTTNAYTLLPSSIREALKDRFFWYDPSDLSTITKDGNNIVTAISDKLGNGNNFTEGSVLWSSNTLLFNGISHYLKTPAISSMVQPTMIYMIVRQVSWTLDDHILDGHLNNSSPLFQTVSSPIIKAWAGGNVSAAESNLTIGTYCVVRLLLSSANSKLIVNNNTPATGNFGTSNMGGFTLGRAGSSASGFSNIQVRDIIAMPSSANEIEIYDWLASKL